ncbi:MAG: hypothetical protein KF841_07215 [Phycisphaerae bacterium]|nr:hypothetical protein [Phycisphaerae bacterium]
MSFAIKKATIWKIETPNTPGAMASTLGPLAESGVNLDLVMGYTNAEKTLASVEVYPIAGGKSQTSARTAGFSKADFPCVVISGKNQPGIGRRIAAALADAGVSINFFVAQAAGPNYVGLFSFEAQSEADLAVRILNSELKKPESKSGSRGLSAGSRKTNGGGKRLRRANSLNQKGK